MQRSVLRLRLPANVWVRDIWNADYYWVDEANYSVFKLASYYTTNFGAILEHVGGASWGEGEG